MELGHQNPARRGARLVDKGLKNSCDPLETLDVSGNTATVGPGGNPANPPALETLSSDRVLGWLVLLCHRFCRCLRDNRRMQHWHRCRVIAIATANKRWMVAIELGTWRCGRIGGAAGSVTAGKGRFFDCSGAMRC